MDETYDLDHPDIQETWELEKMIIKEMKRMDVPPEKAFAATAHYATQIAFQFRCEPERFGEQMRTSLQRMYDRESQ